MNMTLHQSKNVCPNWEKFQDMKHKEYYMLQNIKHINVTFCFPDPDQNIKKDRILDTE